jgi:predicted DsbA family dithiol-disulfide isomerase
MLERVEKAGSFLIGIMSLLFVPATVGLMAVWGELSEMLGLSPEILKEALKAREAVQEVSIDQKRRNEVDIKEPIEVSKIKREMKKRGHEK